MTPEERRALGLPTYFRSDVLLDVPSLAAALRAYRGPGVLHSTTTTASFRTRLRLTPESTTATKTTEITVSPVVEVVAFGLPPNNSKQASGADIPSAWRATPGSTYANELAEILEQAHGGLPLAAPMRLVEVQQGAPRTSTRVVSTPEGDAIETRTAQDVALHLEVVPESSAWFALHERARELRRTAAERAA